MNRVDSMNRGFDRASPMAELHIPSLKDKVSSDEWAIRVDLAAAYRLVAYTAGTISSSPTCRRASRDPSIISCSIPTN